MLDRLRRHFAWRADLKALDAQLSREPRPVLDAPTEREPGVFVWRLVVPGQPAAYMMAEAGKAPAADLYVVPVQATAFYRKWLAGGLQSRERPDGSRLRAELASDSKFHHAAAGFAEGERSPVPLARVAVDGQGAGAAIRFNDGITRTLWLLANRVRAFPVVVTGQAEAETLAAAVGVGKPVRLSDLALAAEAARKPPEATPERQEATWGGKGRVDPDAPPRSRSARLPGRGRGMER